MELGLYVYLIIIIYSFRQFLRAIDVSKMEETEKLAIKQKTRVFNTMIFVIIGTMVCSSVYQACSPWLYFGATYTLNQTQVNVYQSFF